MSVMMKQAATTGFYSYRPIDPSVEKRPPTPFPALMRRLDTQSGVVARTLTTPAIVDATTLSSGVSPVPLRPLEGFAAAVFPKTLEVITAAAASVAKVAPALAPRARSRRRLASKAACGG